MKTHIKMFVRLAIVLLFVVSGTLVFSQQITNIPKLLEFSEQLKNNWLERQKRVNEFSARYNIPIRQELANGKIMEMVDVRNNRAIYYTTDNLGAAITTRANTLWSGGSLGLSVDGEGYTGLGEWDGGAVRASHDEFTSGGTQISRVIQMDGASSISNHATHVAGTLIAEGVSGNAKGMNSKATLKAWDWTNDNAEMAGAAANGLQISNHSYSYIHGWYYNGSNWSWYGDSNISTEEDYRFGLYTGSTRAWDQIAYDAPYYLIVKSAGNDRFDGPSNGAYPQDGAPDGYDCIGTQSIAKNILTVGAVYQVADYTDPSSVVMSSFSSWGPADDGRIKPDIVGKGVSLYSSLGGSDSQYASYSGTSMSSPNVAGTLALLQQHYQNNNGGASMRASTLKALAINTADECGDYPGPDYKFGWGLLNAKKAAQLITKDAIETNIMDELSLDNGGVFTTDINTDGTEPLIVTIVWTDPAGIALENAVDPLTAALVNDLDLAVLGNNTTYYPYKLDPGNPSAAATNNSENNVDNVELVNIANPVPGTYTIKVDHDGILAQAQHFSLVISGATASPPKADDAGISSIINPAGSNCFSVTTPTVKLTNYGTNELTSVTINYQVSGTQMHTYNWEGSLNGGASENVNLPQISVPNGSNTFTAYTSNPNGSTDENPQNDQASSTFSLGISLTLTIVLDNYPGETSWNITDGSSDIIASGGAYGNQPSGSTVIEDICAPAGCLNFTIFDSYGDGICCAFGNGSYELRDNASGTVLASGGSFSSSETTDFCIPVNSPPSFTSNPVVESGATEDEFYTSTLMDNATDAENDELTFSKVTGPQWLTIDSTGVITGTPANEDAGLNQWTVMVSDGNGGSDQAELNITVANTNDAPIFDTDPVIEADALMNSPYSGTLADNVSDVDGDALSIYKVSGPAWLNIATDGTLSGTPTVDDMGSNRWQITVSDGKGGADTADLVIAVMDLIYCSSSGEPSFEYIQSINVPGLFNDSGSDGGYKDFSDLGSIVLETGSQASFVLTPGFNGRSTHQYWAIWIDYDLNGFDNNDLVYVSLKSKSAVSGSFVVGNQLVSTRMRISMSDSGTPGPCGPIGGGEVEDYQVNIVPAGIKTPVADFIADNTDVVTGSTVNFTDLSDNPAIWDWSFPGGTPSSSASQNPSVVYNAEGTYDVTLTVSNGAGSDVKTVISYIHVSSPAPPVADFIADFTTVYVGDPIAFTDLSSNLPTSWSWSFGDGQISALQNPVISYGATGNYTVSLTASNSFGSDSETKTGYITVNEAPPSLYCEPSNIDNTSDYINSVNIEGTPNNSGQNSNGYTFFSSPEFTFIAGQTYNFTVSPLTTNNRNFWRIWIDANSDGDFEDANETLFVGNNKKGAVSGNITIPADISTDNTRLRISMKTGSSPSPCDDIFNGEVEDYIANISILNIKGAFIESDIIDSDTEQSVTVYPNPFKNEINISLRGWDEKEKTNIQILDISGRLIHNEIRACENIITLQNLHLVPGTYFVRIRLNEYVKTEQLIKIK